MKLLKIIAALLGIGGIAAAVCGASATNKSMTLGAGMMIGGVVALAIAVLIVNIVKAEEEGREAEEEQRGN